MRREFVRRAWLSLLLVFVLCASTARADDEAPRAFRFDARLEGTLAGVGAAAFIGAELLKPVLAPKHCRLCGNNPLDLSVRKRARWDNVVRAQRTAHALLFGVVPVVSVGGLMALSVGQASRHDTMVDAMVMFESFLLTANVTLLAKFSTARRRPFVKAGSEAQRDVLTGPQEDNISFFSGHTSTTFALAVAAGATASFRGYKYANVVWGVGVPLAALTGYLSIAADRHYFTDVLTGALVGSAIGVLIPWLHRHGADDRMPTVSAAPGTIMFSWVR
ncbi:MAG: hypothetical protein RLZZ450_2996 [Pseudomonadota bacterium]|jgi:hypothetical protein